MKTFYTERDIEKMHAAGRTEIEISDDVVLTDIAVEKAVSLGIRRKRIKKPSPDPPEEITGEIIGEIPEEPSGDRRGQGDGVKSGDQRKSETSPPPIALGSGFGRAGSKPAGGKGTADAVSAVKERVVKRLGTQRYNDLLDRIIPLVCALLGDQFPAAAARLNNPADETDMV